MEEIKNKPMREWSNETWQVIPIALSVLDRVQKKSLEDNVEGMAERYVWSHCGRGNSTSVGVHMRQLIRDAFTAGYYAAPPTPQSAVGEE